MTWWCWFLLCILRGTDMKPHGRFVWQDQREGWNQKAVWVLRLSPKQSPLQKRKERWTENQPLSYTPLCGSPSSSLFIVTSSADTAKLKDCSCVYLSLLLRFQSDLGPFHRHCLPLKSTFSPGRKGGKKNNTSGQWNCLVTQKGVIIEINHPILFHN